MNICKCGAEMKPLLTSWFCPKDCDRTKERSEKSVPLGAASFIFSFDGRPWRATRVMLVLAGVPSFHTSDPPDQWRRNLQNGYLDKPHNRYNGYPGFKRDHDRHDEANHTSLWIFEPV